MIYRAVKGVKSINVATGLLQQKNAQDIWKAANLAIKAKLRTIATGNSIHEFVMTQITKQQERYNAKPKT